MIKLLFIILFSVTPNVFLLKSRIQVKHILKSNNCEVEKADGDGIYCDCEDYYIKILFDKNGVCKGLVKTKKIEVL
jgi:hypothetical protein